MKNTKKKPADRKRLAPSLAAFRSSITNGTSLFVGVDERSAYSRRFRDVLAAHTSDCGGSDNISEAERSLIRRATTLTVALERLESKFAEHDGEASTVDLLTYQRIVNTLRRTLKSIGLKRRAKDITGPSLGDILREGIRRDREAADAEIEGLAEEAV